MFIILVLAGIVIFYLYDLFSAFLGALMLYLLSQRPKKWLKSKGFSPGLAAIFLLIVVFLMIVLPFVGIGLILGNHVDEIARFSKQYYTYVSLLITKLYTYPIFQGIQLDEVSKYLEKLGSLIPSLLNNTLEIFTTIVFTLLIYYFLLIRDIKIERFVLRFLPLSSENKRLFMIRLNNLVLSNAVAIPLVAFVQAVIAWIGYLIIGLDKSFIWFLATFVTSMIPVVGSGIIYLPIAGVLLLIGKQSAGIFLLIWGLVVVSSSDNVLRMFVLKKLDNTHPMVTILGVILGLKLFGFLGLIYGPILITLLFLLIDMYHREYQRFK
ncbi:MAG: AI-2E family transporter [Chitinophagales bacterium]|nr:AI-2E family transporter [Chitinophagales bacterium]